GVRCTPAGQQVPVRVEDAHPTLARLCNGTEALRGVARVPPEFGDVGPTLGVKDDVGGPLDVRPLTQVLAVRAEDLDTVALPVTDEDAAIRRHGDAVRQIELSRAAAWRAPRTLELPAGGELMHTAVAVPIGHVQVAFRANRNVGGAVERACSTRDGHEVLAVIPGVRRCIHDAKRQ